MTFTSTNTRKWVDHKTLAEHLGIHPQTAHKIRRAAFKEGVHYRRTGLTTRGPLQYDLVKAEEAFTRFRRMPAVEVETFSRELVPTSR
jgi:hypothetical protein